MRAVVVREFGGIDKAALGDMPKPELTPDGVLLDVHAASVNFVDLVVMGGTYQFSPKLPYIPGKLPVGIVAAVGTDVKDVKPGDRVLAMAEQGAFAEQVMAPAKQCVPLPAALPFTEAAAMALIYDTAYFALKERGRIQPGESVLILGATGGVGLAAIQLAKAMGGKVLAAVASKSKEDIVHAAGADEIIDLSAPDLRESLRAQVYEKVGKGGVDIIIDMLGGDPFDAAVRALGWNGRLVIIGFASGRVPSLKMNYVLVKNIEVSGMQISDYRKRRPADMQACFRQIFEWHANGKLKPLPTTVYPLEQFAAAMHAIQDRTVRGRVVLTMRT
jgi:NADPH2:quinone reductase